MAFGWKNSLLLLSSLGLLLISNGLSGQEAGQYRYDDMINVKADDLFTFPQLVVESNEQTTAGYYLFEILTYLAIIDHFGNPLFYKEIPEGAKNFESQPDGSYSYYANSSSGFLVMNENFQITDTFTKVNDGGINFHEFNILENGNYIILGYDHRVINMSQYVEGGEPSATVTGMVFQELDPDKNPIFHWNSWDHFNFLESDTNFVNFTAQSIDYVHLNSITLDYDDHFLLSSRHLSEVTKIDRVTGGIIWRMGGTQNDFNFVNDTIGFSGQHSAVRLPNGNIALFDNGNGHEPQFSRGVEYAVDEVGKTVNLVHEFRASPDLFSSIMGSVTSLPGDHLVVGWSKNSSNALLDEFDEVGALVTSISLPPASLFKTYRVSFLKQFNFFVVPGEDALNFGEVETGDSVVLTVELSNQGVDPATLFAFTDASGQFEIVNEMPLQIPEGAAEQVSLKFKPTVSGNYSVPVYLNFRLDSTIFDDHMVACRLMLRGTTSAVSSTGKYQTGKELRIFPNPFHDLISIENSEDVISVVIWSMTGEKVFQVQGENRERLVLDQIHLDPGFYLIELLFRDGTREFVKVVKSR